MKIALILSVLFFSTGIGNQSEQLLPTKLKITVIDGLGNIVEGASVAIYEKEEDYRASDNAVGVGTTDKKGRVTFKGLKLIPYFVEAKKDDQNNNGEGVVTGELSEGKINKVNTVIE